MVKRRAKVERSDKLANKEESDWYTVETIDEETFVISEYRHWEETHCYLLIGETQCLLIDTGLGVGNIKEVVDQITTLPIEVVTTHVHWDHIGGHGQFQWFGVHEAEKEWINGSFPLPLEVVKRNLVKDQTEFPKDFRLETYQVFQGEPSWILKDNDVIELGNRSIQVIHTPGHSPGHVCFYEKEKGYLYSGDLVYEGKLDAFYPTTDPVEFLSSIQKLRQLRIKKILPGHHKRNIPVELLNEIEQGFVELLQAGQLKQGNGIFEFPNFKIHI